jgi:protein TonB
MSATLYSFPAADSFNSPRSWMLAAIVLIHLAFFWLLTSGMGRSLLMLPPTATEAYVIPDPPKPPPREFKLPEPTNFQKMVYVPPVIAPTRVTVDDDTAPRATTQEIVTEPERRQAEPLPHTPVDVLPEIDPRRGLSEPLYPSALIRDGIGGTVVLSIQVLENGRVGEVRIERSSGEPKLDESAAREARRWRFIPGTRDGVPVTLWKQVPVTFRVQDRR